MDSSNSSDRNLLIDLESGTKEVINEQFGERNTASTREQAAMTMSQVWSGLMGIDRMAKGEEDLRSGNGVSNSVEFSALRVDDLGLVDKGFGGEENVGLMENKANAEIPKKKWCKKASKPPRPPKSPSLDLADQKLMRELTELAALKRARIERMKKKIKNTKLSSNNNSNMFALIITILFGLVIIWQGFYSHGNSSIRFHGSPEASVQARDGLISIQFYKNTSQLAPGLSRSVSPNNAMPIATLVG